MKWIIAGVVTLLVVVGGVGAYVILGDEENKTNNSQTASVNSDKSSVAAETVSIEQLLRRDASLKCTYNVKVGESTSSGTAYFSGGKNMYGEFTISSKDFTNTAYVIRNGDTQYVWQKGSKTGYKADVSAYKKEKQQQMSQQFDPEKKYKFSCENWEEDASLFQPPTSVTFTDIAAQTKKLQEQFQNR